MNDTIPTPRTEEALIDNSDLHDQGWGKSEMVHADFARQLERELTALRALTDWRGIESAPKDGCEILVIIAGIVEVARWNNQRYQKNPRPYWERILTRDRAAQPLLWLPLPTPPKI